MVTVLTSAEASIFLNAKGSKIKGRQKVDLTWSGASSTNVDIIHDSAVIATVSNALGGYTDNIGAKGGGTYIYALCEAGTSICSDNVVVVF